MVVMNKGYVNDIAMPNLDQDVDDEVSQYFRNLGFGVTWDFSRDHRECWYEILDTHGRLLCQIDMGTPLAAVLEDLPLLTAGKPGTSTMDYTINGTLETLALVCKRLP